MIVADWRISSGRMAGKPYTFDAFPCAVDIVRDESLNQAVMKSAQMAVSELFSLARPHWAMDELGINWAVLFPTQGAMHDFFKTRMKSAHKVNPYIRPNVSAENSTNIDAFGHTTFLRYTTTETAIATFDASGITVDEQDLHNRDTLYGVQVSRRQGEMDDTFWFDISTPSFPNAGIHKSYLISDQKVWLIKCGHCGHDNDLTTKIGEYDVQDLEKFFREFLDENRFENGWKDYFIPCSKCGKAIDPVTPLDKAKSSNGGGRWVARFPKRDVSGRHLQIFQRLYTGGTPVVLQRMREGLLKAQKPEHIRRWWNFTVGMPYVPKEGRLSDEDLFHASTSAYDDRWVRDPHYEHMFRVEGMPVSWMGVDVRDQQYHIVGLKRAPEDRFALTCLGWVEDSTQVIDLWRRYGEPVFLEDALPDTNESRRLVKAMGRRGTRGKFGAGFNNLWQETNEDQLILVNRPRVMELVNAFVKSRHLIMPRKALDTGAGIFQSKGDSQQEERFRDHLKAPVMVKKESEVAANEIYDFPKDAMGGVDPHYYMALCLALVASELRGAPGQIIVVPR